MPHPLLPPSLPPSIFSGKILNFLQERRRRLKTRASRMRWSWGEERGNQSQPDYGPWRTGTTLSLAAESSEWHQEGGSNIPDMQTCSVAGMHPSNNYIMQWRSLLVLFLHFPHLQFWSPETGGGWKGLGVRLNQSVDKHHAVYAPQRKVECDLTGPTEGHVSPTIHLLFLLSRLKECMHVVRKRDSVQV